MMKKLPFFLIIILTILFNSQVTAQKTSSYADEIFAEHTLGEQEPKLGDHISFYPNPISDKFSINNETGLNIVKIELHSIVGNRVRIFFISNENELKDIYIDELKRGIYFVTLYFENEQTLTQKILKK
jgi:hypothetical protein